MTRANKADVQSRLQKALGDSDVGTVLDRENIDVVVRDIVDHENPMRQNIRRRPGNGQALVLNRRTPGTTTTHFTGDKATTHNLSDPSYVQTSFPYKTILTRGQMSRRLVRQGQTYGDVLGNEIDFRAADMADFEDNAILTSTVAGDANAFDGLQTLITTQVAMIGTTSIGANLALLKVDEAIDASNRTIDMMIMAKRTRRELFQLLLNKIETVEVRGGFRLASYAGIPIFVSTNIPITQTTTGAGLFLANTTGDQTEILFINNSELFISELTPMTFEEVDFTTTQIESFEIFEDLVVVVGNTLSAVRLVGISPTPPV